MKKFDYKKYLGVGAVALAVGVGCSGAAFASGAEGSTTSATQDVTLASYSQPAKVSEALNSPAYQVKTAEQVALEAQTADLKRQLDDANAKLQAVSADKGASDTRADDEAAKADEANHRADDEKARADREKERADKAEARIKELEAALSSKNADATPSVRVSEDEGASDAVTSVKDADTQKYLSGISDEKRKKLVASALSQLGNKQDCTALVTNALRSIGINHHGWPESYQSLGHQVDRKDAKPGDIVFYPTNGVNVIMANGKLQQHVALVVANDNGNITAVHGGWNGNDTALWGVDIPGASEPVFISIDD